MSNEANNEAEVPSEYLLDLTQKPDNAKAPEQKQEQEPEYEVPEKFKGKSVKDIVEGYRNLETELGRARNEIGNQRRLTDELLGINRATAVKAAASETPSRKKLTPDEILSDPETAVLSVVKEESAARAKADEERLARIEFQMSMDRFEKKHPDYQATQSDPAFAAWLQQSPFRARLAQAAVNGDLAAADELFSLYGEVKSAAQSREEAPSPTEQARKAGLARPGSSSTQGVSNPANKPLWSREKLLEMRLNNPEEFDRRQPEILKAYAEGRVR